MLVEARPDLVSLVLFLNRTSHPIMRSLVPDPRHTGRKMTEVEIGRAHV